MWQLGVLKRELLSICTADRVALLKLLKICTSDLCALLKRHSLCTKAICPRRLEHPTSRIRSTAQGQVFVHDEFLEIWALEAVRRGQMDAPEAQSLC